MSNIQKAIAAHHNFLMGSFITRVEEKEYGSFIYSELLDSYYWNYLLPNEKCLTSPEKVISAVKSYYKEQNRRPCLQLSNGSPELIDSLSRAGFKLEYQDVWMFYEGGQVEDTVLPKIKITACETEKELETFLEVFFAAYSGVSPDEPYGALPPEYGEAFKKSFYLREEKGLYLSILYFNDQPAAISELGFNEKLACLYGLGVKPEFRKQGLAEILTRHRIKIAQEKGANAIFLQTEAGSYNEKLFTRYGFKSQVCFKGYVLEKNN